MLFVLFLLIGTLNSDIVNGGLLNFFQKNDKKNEKKIHDNAEIRAYANYCVAIDLMLDEDWNTAIKYLKKTLSYDPFSEKIHLYLASSYFQIRQKEPAILHMKEASRLKPDDFHIHYTLGNILRVENEIDQAIYELELAIGCELVEENKILHGDALLNLANLYAENKNIEKAISCLKAVISLNIGIEQSKLYFEIAKLYFEKGEVQDAIDTFKIVKEINPTVYSVHPYLSICYETLDNLDKAIEEAQIYLKIAPNSWNTYISLYRIYTKSGEKDMARIAYKEAGNILYAKVKSGSRDVDEYLALGQILLNQDQKESAIIVLKKGLLLTEDKIKKRDTHFFMSTIYYELGQYDNVELALKATLEIDNDFHQANNFLGYFYAERGRNINEAISLILKALSVQPDNGAYLDSLGWSYYKKAILEDKEDFIELALQKLIEASLIVKDPEVQEHIGDVYYSLGDWLKAEQEWSGALEYLRNIETRSSAKVVARIKKKIEKLNNLGFFKEQNKKNQSNAVLESVNLRN